MIQSAQKESGELGVSLRVPFGGQGKLYGIVAVPETCPKGGIVDLNDLFKFLILNFIDICLCFLVLYTYVSISEF